MYCFCSFGVFLIPNSIYLCLLSFFFLIIFAKGGFFFFLSLSNDQCVVLLILSVVSSFSISYINISALVFTTSKFLNFEFILFV